MAKSNTGDLTDKQKSIPIDHSVFINHVANGVNQSDAYILTYPNKVLTKGTIKVESSKLAKKYAKEIDIERDRLKVMITSVKDSKVVQEALNGLLSQAEVDKKLCDIINGTFEVEDVGMFQGSPIPFTRKPNASEVKAAIDSYNKRFGSNAPVKSQLEITDTGSSEIEDFLKLRKDARNSK